MVCYSIFPSYLFITNHTNKLLINKLRQYCKMHIDETDTVDSLSLSVFQYVAVNDLAVKCIYACEPRAG